MLREIPHIATVIAVLNSQCVNKQSWDLRTDYERLFATQFMPDSWKHSKIVVPCSFKQCFEPAETLFTETCSKVGPFRHLSNHFLWIQ